MSALLASFNAGVLKGMVGQIEVGTSVNVKHGPLGEMPAIIIGLSDAGRAFLLLDKIGGMNVQISIANVEQLA